VLDSAMVDQEKSRVEESNKEETEERRRRRRRITFYV